MTTKETSIAAFSIGDHFMFYGEKFQVTSVIEHFDEKGVIVYARNCALVSPLTIQPSNISELLKQYTRMQGTDAVTYSKIIEG